MIDSWSKKLTSHADAPARERAWLTHELGYCYLKTDDAAEARWCGELSLKASQQAQDRAGQLSANLLIAQAIRKS